MTSTTARVTPEADEARSMAFCGFAEEKRADRLRDVRSMEVREACKREFG